jgi:plastocyanin
MKNIIPAILILWMHSSSIASVHIITCQNSPSHFLPVKVNARVGDTIRWVWVEGGHIVGPISTTDIPKGAAPFNAPIDEGHTSFEYVVTMVGNYTYDCHPASPHGETASIVVTSTTGVKESVEPGFHFNVFPNPSKGKFQIEIDETFLTQTSSIEVHNLQGELVFQTPMTQSRSYHVIDAASKGVYLVSLHIGSVILTRKLIID